MLHLFYGNDTITVRQKAHDFTAAEEKKGMKVEHIEVENYVEGVFSDIVGAVSLFGEKTLYIIDTLSGKTEMYDALIENLEAFASSDNTFVVIEGALLAPQKKKFQKHAETMEEYKAVATELFNVFSMADSLARKDKKTLWLQLQDARHTGLKTEAIIGTLWWQLKSMRLAKATNNAKEAGMKDFSYNKAKRALSIFKDGELETLSKSLLTVYHDGHLGKVDTDIALERWMLTL